MMGEGRERCGMGLGGQIPAKGASHSHVSQVLSLCSAVKP